jgi:hypothetical protein
MTTIRGQGETAAAEDPLLVPTDRGPTLQWRGLSLYPPQDPIEYARRRARVFSAPPGTLVYVPSVGLGHGLAELVQHLPEGCAVLCVEAFQEIMGMAMTQSLPRDPRLAIVRTTDPEGAATALEGLALRGFRRLVELPLCAGYRLAPDVYKGIKGVLEERIRRHWQNRLTLIAMGSLQVRNIVSNLGFLPGAGDVAALSSALPVVVAGAGPSLEECLPALARLRSRFTLVAVDTALPALMAQGIVPDVVVALEAQLANLQDFIPARASDTVLACDLSSHPSVLKLFPGKLFFFSSRFAPLRIFDRLAEAGLQPSPFPPLGSVGVAAVHAALRMTGREVIVAGLDFSFPRSATHARGTPHLLAALLHATRLRPVDQETFQALASRGRILVADKKGLPVATDLLLQSYRDSLAALAAECPGRVLDLGPTGLSLGVQAVSPSELAELLAGAPPQGPRLRIDPARRFPTDALRRLIESERELLLRMAGAAREASARTEEASEECRALLREADYVWIHFPDEPDLGRPGRSFLARAAVAARYYAERLERVALLV